MPDSPERRDQEAKLQAVIAALLADLQEAALSRLSDNPVYDDLPQWFYVQAKQVIKAEIAPILRDVAFGAAVRTSGEMGWEIDALSTIAEVNRKSEQQAELVASWILSKLQVSVGDHIRQARAGEAALGVYLVSLWGSGYDEGLAITETTRAITSGEDVVVDQFERREQGGGRRRPTIAPRTLQKIWHTQRDEKVCPICSPLDGRTDVIWAVEFPGGPPAHPHCRCYLTYQIKPGIN